jgi:hypothetical protein
VISGSSHVIVLWVRNGIGSTEVGMVGTSNVMDESADSRKSKQNAVRLFGTILSRYWLPLKVDKVYDVLQVDSSL